MLTIYFYMKYQDTKQYIQLYYFMERKIAYVQNQAQEK